MLGTSKTLSTISKVVKILKDVTMDNQQETKIITIMSRFPRDYT